MKLLFYTLTLFICSHLTSADNDPKCGTNGPVDSKIIGGEEATPYEFSWLVSMGITEGASPNWLYKSFCGGAIIAPSWILTAAHCYGNWVGNALAGVIAGVHNVSLQAPEQRRQTEKIAKWISHPKYEELADKSARYDLALIKLENPLKIADNPTLGTICVPPQDSTYNPYVGKLVVTAGWGRTVPNDKTSVSQVLRKVTLPVADMDWCRRVNSITDDQDKANTMFCTYQVAKDTCSGDSGGPLMMKVDGKWTVVGVISWGIGCAETDHPGMNTHVSLFSDWIWETIRANS